MSSWCREHRSVRNTLINPRLYLVLLGVASPAPASAAEWQVQPTARLSIGYNDNLRLATGNKISTAEVSFSPSATFRVLTPSSGASGLIGFDFRRFDEDSNLSEDNLKLQVDAFRQTERSRFDLNLGAVRDSTLDTQLEETGIAFDRIQREKIAISPGWNHSLDERTSISASYSYSDVQYENTDQAGFFDYKQQSTQLSLTRVLTPRTSASLTLTGSRSSNDNEVESENLNAQAGLSYAINETLSASLAAGARRTSVDITRDTFIFIRSGNNVIDIVPSTDKQSSSDTGLTFSASISKSFLRGDTLLSASRDVSNDINGQPFEVTRLTSVSSYRLNETLSFRLSLDFFNSQSTNPIGTALDRKFYRAQPEINWALDREWSLSAYYAYRLQAFNDISDDAVQNTIYFTLAYNWPRLSRSR